MTTVNDNARPPAPPLPTLEVAGLLAEVASQAMVGAVSPPRRPFKETVSPADARATLLSSRQMRKIHLHQQGFATALTSRLSLFLRAEFSVTLADIQLAPYQQMTGSWPDPAHLTLFKTEPLRGVSLLEIPSRLGICLVDRLMGGPGTPGDPAHELSAIENALLEQVVQIVLTEWCGHCAPLKELKPVILGCESNARFLQTAAPQATMLVVSLNAALGRCQEQIQLGFPFAALEPLLRQLAQDTAVETEMAAAPALPAASAWNSRFDNVCIPVAAEWRALEVAARAVLNLQVGDVLKIDAASAQQVQVRLGENAKFYGRLGVLAGKWAVELTEAVKP